MADGTCSTDGCAKAVFCRCLCKSHYEWLRKRGLLTVDRHRALPVADRFWAKVDKSGDCWVWTSSLYRFGYGQFFLSRGKSISAHRYAYEALVGPVPQGLELDHLCHTRDLSCPGGWTCPHRKCVNPAHLEPVTHAENMARGRNAGRTRMGDTHCQHGHEFTPENTYRRPNGSRQCRACRAAHRRSYRTKSEAASLPPQP